MELTSLLLLKSVWFGESEKSQASVLFNEMVSEVKGE